MEIKYLLKSSMRATLFIFINQIAMADTTDVSKNIGEIYIFGTLTENTCQLEMESFDQSVDLGNIPISELQNIGDKGRATPFQIKIVDCSPVFTDMHYYKTDTNTWSSSQPGLQIQFLATSIDNHPNLISVNGAKGIGLELSDENGDFLTLGSKNRPKLLAPPQNILSYYLTPVRVSKLESNVYHTIISFELSYE